MTSHLAKKVLFLSSSLVLAAAGLTGCKTTIADPVPVDFAQIRLMNFATCSEPMDVYIEPAIGKQDSLPAAPGLKFGLSSVYTSNLNASPAGTVYHIIARPVNNRTAELAHADVTVHPSEKWSTAIYSIPSSNSYPADTMEDASASASGKDQSNVYIRFLNTYSNSNFPKLAVRINDNLNGMLITPAAGIGFRQHTDYVQIPIKPDTSFTFMIVDPNGGDSVIGRLAGVSFSPGSYQTITYTGDPCAVRPQNPQDISGDAADSLRVRVFDDNSLGNDLITSPVIPLTLRYNFVNALIPNPTADPAKFRYYTQLGVVINNDGNITIPGLTPLSSDTAVGPFTNLFPIGATDNTSGGTGQFIYNTVFTSTPLTAAVDVKVYRTDNVPAGGRGQLLADYNAGAKTNMISDLPVSLIYMDTCLPLSAIPDSANVQQYAIPIPDNAIGGMARIVLVNALTRTSSVSKNAQADYVTMSVNGVTDPNMNNKKPTSFDNTYPPLSPGLVTIKAVTKTISGITPTTVTTTFNAQAGQIYEVVLAGQPSNPNKGFQPQFIVIDTNPTK